MTKKILIVLIFILSGCTLAPKYKRPSLPVADKFPTQGVYKNIKYNEKEINANDIHWQEFILDNKLKQIIKISLNNNRDLKLATLNVEQARALYGIKSSEIYPSLYLTSGLEKQRIPKDLSPIHKAYTSKKYSVNLGLAEWEIDFFGKIRSLKKEALENFFAVQENKRAAQISLITEIVRTYLLLATHRENKNLTLQLLETAKENYRLVYSQYQVGLATEMDLNHAQIVIQSLEVEIKNLDQLISLDINKLNFLVGNDVKEELLPLSLPNSKPFEEFKPGLSSLILLNRPDIQAAEHRLKAAYANIGAARAALFPSISLIAGVGTASDELSNLFKSSSETWNFGLRGALPLLDARVWQAYKLSKVQRKLVLTQYEKTIQKAFKEVLDRLVVAYTIREQISAQQKLIHLLENNYNLALKRYNQGIDSYFPVLRAYENLLLAKQKLSQLLFTKYVNHLGLYAAFGGGGE